MKQLAWLCIGALMLWAVLTVPAQWYWGEGIIVPSATALAACLLPAAVSLAVSQFAAKRSSQWQLVAVLGGMSLRMFVVLGAGVVLSLTATPLQTPVFWVWLIVFYLLILWMEIGLVLSARRTLEKQPRLETRETV